MQHFYWSRILPQFIWKNNLLLRPSRRILDIQYNINLENWKWQESSPNMICQLSLHIIPICIRMKHFNWYPCSTVASNALDLLAVCDDACSLQVSPPPKPSSNLIWKNYSNLVDRLWESNVANLVLINQRSEQYQPMYWKLSINIANLIKIRGEPYRPM